MVTRICQYCGKTYETFPSVRPRYCSHTCASAAKIKSEFVPCAYCGTLFRRYPSTPTRKYCSHSCATSARNLTDQNPSYHRDISGSKNPMYGKRATGPANPMYGRRGALAPRWKGGRKQHALGYFLVVAPDDHPYPSYTKPSGTKYILEHRFVMEQHLGRYLKPTEVVHHINEIKTDNRIENLKLCNSQAAHMHEKHGNC